MILQPTIAITAGDPCGIGPEIILKALAAKGALGRIGWVVIGDLRVFERTAKSLRLRMPNWDVVRPTDSSWPARHRLTLLDLGYAQVFHPGHSSALAGRASLDAVDHAIRLWRRHRLDGLVTAPVTKWAIERSHPKFVGQTEYLAKACGTTDVVMMFVADTLRVVLLTRHVPLRAVARSMNRRLLRTTLQLTVRALRTQFHVARPSLAICGLNPHAGEAGTIGREERRVLEPVLREIRRMGGVCDGPFAADGFFAQPHRYDAVVCAYHDQGLIPFKMVARDRGCQMTLGLPIIRTSPDHGSALNIAGQGIANPGSMIYAMNLAATLIR